MRNVSHASFRENQSTHFTVDALTFSENHTVYEIMWKIYGRAGQATDDNIIQRMRFAGWITKATKTPSEYIIITDFPLQQWLLERASMLRYTYTQTHIK
jgi:hypothetical protein